MTTRISRSQIEGALRGKKLGSAAEAALRKTMGTGRTGEAKRKFAGKIGRMTETGRKKFYKESGMKRPMMKRLEASIKGDDGPQKAEDLPFKERMEQKKAQEKKVKTNIFLSKKSAEEGAGPGWETTKSEFLGEKEVEVRTVTGERKEEAAGADARTGAAGDLSKQAGFALGKPGTGGSSFAKSKSGDDDDSDEEDGILIGGSSGKGQGTSGGEPPLGF